MSSLSDRLDRSLGSGELKADMRMIPSISLDTSKSIQRKLTSKSHNIPFEVGIRSHRNVQGE